MGFIKCEKCGKNFDNEKYFGLCPKCGRYNNPKKSNENDCLINGENSENHENEHINVSNDFKASNDFKPDSLDENEKEYIQFNDEDMQNISRIAKKVVMFIVIGCIAFPLIINIFISILAFVLNFL